MTALVIMREKVIKRLLAAASQPCATVNPEAPDTNRSA
jgi:hypothetical protein